MKTHTIWIIWCFHEMLHEKGYDVLLSDGKLKSVFGVCYGSLNSTVWSSFVIALIVKSQQESDVHSHMHTNKLINFDRFIPLNTIVLVIYFSGIHLLYWTNTLLYSNSTAFVSINNWNLNNSIICSLKININVVNCLNY